jgi:hypothetical protein
MQVRAHLAARGAGGVQRDARRRALVAQADLRHMQKELGEFENPLGQRFGLGQQLGIVGENLGIMVTHHAGAGTGRNDHRPRLRETGATAQRHRARLLGKAAAVRRLPAAGLVGREMHLDSFALEQADGVSMPASGQKRSIRQVPKR